MAAPAIPAGSERWLLALHSSGETLGVAVQRLGGQELPRLAAFPLGRGLSGALLTCVESVLPASQWPSLGRLAVAIGPGGFTGTRLTVVLARTLAQQLGLPLDGVGSFRLIAQRLLGQGAVPQGPFWVVQELPRRGLVAGLYAPDAGFGGCGTDLAGAGEGCWGAAVADRPAGAGPLELLAPRLYREESALVEAEAALLPAGEEAPAPRCPAEVRQPDDVAELLRFSQAAAALGRPAPWSTVVPLYPTSPVDGAP
jgi:tRNA threonylcarbamoyl adenosine modification protein YeaZ